MQAKRFERGGLDQTATQRRCNIRSLGLGLGRQANRCQLTESAPPEPFAGRDGYECLGRPPVEVPVLFIPRPDEVQIYGKGRIPGRHIGRLGDAGHLRGQGGVGAEMRQLDNACQLEETALDSQLVPVSYDIERHLQRVAGLRAEVVRRPAVEQHLRRLAGRRHLPGDELQDTRIDWWRKLESRHRRVGQSAITESDRVGQVGEYRQGGDAPVAGQLVDRPRDNRPQHELVALDGQKSLAGYELQADVQEVEALSKRLLEDLAVGGAIFRRCRSGHQQEICPILSLESALQLGQGNKGVERHRLAGRQAEASDAPIGQHGHDRQPLGLESLCGVSAAQQRLLRNAGGALEGEQHGVADSSTQLALK